MPTFSADGSSTYTYTPDGAAVIQLYGAGGGSGSGKGQTEPGGSGGYVSIDIEPGTEIEIAVGTGGGAPGGGSSPAGDGGDGNAFNIFGDPLNGGGGGGATTVRRTADNALLAAADAGGGGSCNFNESSAAGGGGARGGQGAGSAGDGAGSGFGGDGGGTDEPGAPGGTETGGGVTVNSAQTGGGNAGDAVVVVSIIPPSAPTDASQSIVDDTTIDVSWSGNDVATEYDVEVSEDGGSYQQVATTGSTSITYNATPATNEHQFRVRASNSGGDSGWSYTDTKSTDPSNLIASADSFAPISLSWGAVPSADEYKVYRSQSAGSAPGDYVEIDTTETGSYDDTGVASQQTYYYRVQATYPGTDSQLSNEASASIPYDPPVIDTLDASTLCEVTVSWTLQDDAMDGEVEIYRSTDGSLGSLAKTITDPSTTQWTDTGLQDGTEYHYTVRRVVGGESADSEQQSATTILPAPTGLVVNDVRADEADVSFRDNTDNKQGYQVFAGADGYLEFGGQNSGEYVEASSGGLQGLDTKITIAVDVRPTNLDNNYRRVCQQGDNNEGNGILFEQSGEPNGSVSVDGERTPGQSYPSEFEVGERDTLVFTYDAATGEYNYYKGGTNTETGTGATGTLDTFSSPLRISTTDGGNQFAGEIHRVTYADYVWSQSEVDTFEAGGVPTGALYHYEFNQGSGDTLVDYSGGGYDGTLVNSPTWIGGGPLTQNGSDLDPRYGLKGVEGRDTARINSPPADAALNPNSVAVSFWFTPPEWEGGNDYNSWFVRHSGKTYGMWGGRPGSGIKFERRNNQDQFRSLTTSKTDWRVGEKYFYHGQHDPDTGDWEVYIGRSDGTLSLDASKNSSFTVKDDSGALDIGVNEFDSRIDDVRIYNIGNHGLFTEDEVFATMHDNPPITPVVHLPMDDGSGSTVTDATGNGYDANLRNGEWSTPVAPVRHTLTGLKNGEAYVTRASVFTEDTEVFDQ